MFGEFEFRGEMWARTNDALARWDGRTFVPVALPESPFVDLGGLTYAGRIVGAPVVLGDELVIPVNDVPAGAVGRTVRGRCAGGVGR